MGTSPWTTGPREILKHGLDLLKRDSDTNRRLAIISIDNSVELMIKTFLGLPKRINGLKISRKEFEDFAESFPKLLDALETHSPDKLIGIDLGEIEWYHRLRNQLYHQGNGLTVEKANAEVYAELANLLFKNLFGQELLVDGTDHKELLGEFLSEWVVLETGVHEIAREHSLLGTPRNTVLEALKFIANAGILEQRDYKELNELRTIRNSLIHGKVDYRTLLNKSIVNRVKFWAEKFKSDEL